MERRKINEGGELMEMKRFYNGESKLRHRFIPLFQRFTDNSVMGVCLDSSDRFWRHDCGTRKSGFNNLPVIQRGQIVRVKKPSEKFGPKYNGEVIFTLEQVYDSTKDHGVYTTESHLDDLLFIDWCDKKYLDRECIRERIVKKNLWTNFGEII